MDFDFGYSFGLPSARSPFARLIPTFAGSQYGALNTPITFTGDFEIEAEVAIPDETISVFQLISGQVLTVDWFGSRSNGNVTLKIAGSTTIEGAPVTIDPYDGKIHIWKISRVGTVGTLEIDGIVQVTGVVAATNSTWSEIGSNASGVNLFSGQLLSIKYTDAGTVVANYVFDSGSDLYQFPRGEGLGSELITNGKFDSDIDGWSDSNGAISWESGVLRVTVDAGVVPLGYQSFTTEIGKTYKLIVTATATTVGSPRAFLGNFIGDTSILNKSLLPIGTQYEIIFTATAILTFLSLRVDSITNGDYSEFDNISVQKLPDSVCLLTNFATTDWNRYTQQRNITHDAGVIGEAWVGDNVVVNGTFDTDLTGWSLNGDGSIAQVDGELKVTFGTVAVTSARQALSNLIGINILKFIGREVTTILGQIRITNGANVSEQINSTVNVERISLFETTGSNINLDCRLDSVGEVYFDNVSVQHLLEVAA